MFSYITYKQLSVSTNGREPKVVRAKFSSLSLAVLLRKDEGVATSGAENFAQLSSC
jgi:hypothetical protein